MKQHFKIIIAFASFLLPFTLAAQMGKPYEMTIDGVKVIVQPSGNEIVVVQTIIKGGVQNYTADKEGIESLALTSLTECGTAKDDKNSFKDKLDKVSAQLSGNTGMDYATFSMNCIKTDFGTVWPLYVNALTTPRFDAKEFERIKQDAINNIRSNESNPDVAIDRMAKQTAFKGKDYAKDPDGSVATVTKLTPEMVKNYWKSILTKSRLVIVVVSDLDKETIEKSIRSMLTVIPSGKPFQQKKETYTPPANSFIPQERENATNYIQGIASGPQPGTAEFNAFVLAMRIFSSRHFVEIRSKNGLSYAPGAWFSAGATPYSNIYVTTTEPNKYIAVARQLIEKIKAEGFTEQELRNMKTQYLTGVYYRQETNEAQANSLAANEVIHGNWKRSYQIKDDIKKVTLEEINNVFKKYVNHITWSYQGDPKKVNAVMYTQKETPKVPDDKKAF